MSERSLQDTYGPHGLCFGCGPTNDRGLRIKSFPVGVGADPHQEVVCEWRAEAHHQAFPGMLSGGIMGTLLDCHSNWTAAWVLMNRRGIDRPPTTVTARYAVDLKRPVPIDEPMLLRARPLPGETTRDDRVEIEATLETAGEVCAVCRGLFVAVRPGHPAFGRW